MAEALYNEILSNTNNYYYFIGKVLEWDGGSLDVEPPQNTLIAEAETRKEMVFFKKVTTSDVAFTIPRYDWGSGQVYDMYDDALGSYVTLAATAPSANFSYLTGTFDLSKFGQGWLVEGTGIAPGTLVDEATPTQLKLTKLTTGPVTSVTVKKVSSLGFDSIEGSKFYVLTNERNVYKCLDNNGGAPSTIKPFSTSNVPFTTSDGYKWKYMYTIPNSLINKFVSISDIPVTTAIKNAYYSNGSINAVQILSYGSNYQPGDQLVVLGDGSLRDNVYKVLSITIDNPGSGYTVAPAINVSLPYPDAFDFVASTSFASGDYVKTSEGKIYEVVTSGTTGLTAPIHTSPTVVPNGTTTMKFVGLAIDATATITDGGVSDIELEGIVGYVNILSVGSGYDPLNPPEVVINGDGVGATAVAEVTAAGYISRIVITNRGSGYVAGTTTATIDAPVSGTQAVLSVDVYQGYGYTTIPSVTAEDPFVADVVYEDGAVVALGDIVKSGTRFYEALNAGTLGEEIPTHPEGEATSGDVDLLFVGETASLSAFVSKTQAQMSPIIVGGQIVGVNIQDPGQGYTVASISVSSGTGAGAIIEANLSLGDLNTRQATTELLAVPGTIDAIEVLHPGTGYTTAAVTVNGDGSGATATATIEDGAITKITMTNVGVGYTYATVQITGDGENQAYARAIVSPFEGHGKDAVKELFAKDLSFSTTIALDRNQGFEVNNEYRQLGLIKNPTGFADGYRYTGFTGSPCFALSGSFPTAGLDEDDTIEDTDGNEYRVVAFETGDTTSLLVQSLNNVIPQAGTTKLVFLTGDVDVDTVTLPTVDKYSGDLMFIDNRTKFQPTDEQTVSIKTVIRL